MLLEPVSGIPAYPLRPRPTWSPCWIGSATPSATNIGLLADLYHLAVNGDDLDEAIEAYADRIAHVQIADAPGRHEPGTGDLDVSATGSAALAANGYDGYVAAEYAPSGASADSFGWLAALNIDIRRNST